MNYKIFLLVSILLLLIGPANAKSSDLFVDHLTDTIYEDCQGKDINIQQSIIINRDTNEPVTLISWPYGYSTLRRVIEIFGEGEPFAFFQGTCQNKGVSISGIDGCGILTCEGDTLDINQYTYFWNGVRVDVPKEEFNMTYGPNSPIVETHGDNSPVTTGDDSPITQSQTNIWADLFLSKGTIVGTIIGIILSFILKILYASWKKRKKKE